MKLRLVILGTLLAAAAANAAILVQDQSIIPGGGIGGTFRYSYSVSLQAGEIAEPDNTTILLCCNIPGLVAAGGLVFDAQIMGGNVLFTYNGASQGPNGFPVGLGSINIDSTVGPASVISYIAHDAQGIRTTGTITGPAGSSPIPEPQTSALFGLGVVAAGALRAWRR